MVMWMLRKFILPAVMVGILTSNAHAQSNCAADLDGDGVVNARDITALLAGWGPCVSCGADTNGDAFVDAVDLAAVLSRWGGTCAPAVTSLTPIGGQLAGGTIVTIQGDRLLNPLNVRFSGATAVVVSSSRHAVSVVAPAGVSGVATVQITTQGGTTVAGTYVYSGPPTVTSVAPNAGPATGGTAVVITGTNFFGSPNVLFGTVAAPTVVLNSPTQLTATTPPGTSGSSVSVSVVTAAGSGVAQSAFGYLAINVPAWATLLEALPDPSVVVNASLRNAIVATGWAWRVRDNGTGIELLLIPPGSFAMGCSPSSAYSCSNPDNLPVHTVSITNPFYIGRYEVTQEQWIARMGTNPSWHTPAHGYYDANLPVEMVLWNMIAGSGGFLAGTGLRLPTEAEWEYAYRAGTTTAYHGFPGYLGGTSNSSLVGNIAWYQGNAGGLSTHSVGGKFANGFGLHDMAGNVSEWVNDFYSPYYYASSPQVDPQGPGCCSNITRVIRGGSYEDVPSIYGDRLTASSRDSGTPNNPPGNNLQQPSEGFRVARNP